MATDPGDLVLDPTCGSGTTATVAEQWGRRWITIDTSRVALALARTRLMSARYPFYYLADSKEGRTKEQDVSGKIQPDTPTRDDIRQGFVYERAPHVTLKIDRQQRRDRRYLGKASSESLSRCAIELNAVLASRGRNGKSRARPTQNWPEAVKKTPRRVVGSPHRAAEARSTARSPRLPMSNSSTTAPTRTNPASASPARSPSKACRHIASCPPTRTSLSTCRRRGRRQASPL